MNWMSIKEEKMIMWMKISRKFKTYIRKKVEGNREMKKEKKFKTKKFYYTNHTRCQHNPAQYGQHSYKTNLIT